MDKRYAIVGIALSIILLALVILVVGLRYSLVSNDEEGDSFSLVKPAFAQSTGASILEKEAGIAAYVKVASADLSKAISAYRTVEPGPENANYIIGSVGLPNYQSSEDVHVYVQSDGWIVAYYLKSEPTSKIIDYVSYSLSTQKLSTKLDIALSVMSNSLGVAIPEVKYYHFAYPTANNLMLIAESDQFRITVPSGFAVYDRSWSFGESGSPNKMAYGKLTSSQIAPDRTHVVAIKRDYWAYLDIDGTRISQENWYYGGNEKIVSGLALVYQS